MREPNLTEPAKVVLKKRYLLERNGRQETAGEMFRRVAEHVAKAEPPEKQQERADKFFDMLVDLDGLPNSPTLFNAGTDVGMLSACFTFHVQDTLDSIMEVARLAAKVQQWGGGVGYGLSHLRPEGSLVHSTGGKSSGPVGFMALYQSVADVITQGGKRHGAQMAVLHCDHPDIYKFIHCKDDHPEKLNTFNISVALTDEFMRAADSNPLLDEMAQSAWKSGDPGCYFIDRAERDNPTPKLGKLEATNPCGEVPLLHGEACNLGSVNLGNFVTPPYVPYGFDWDRLCRIVSTMTRMLEDVVEVNRFPDQLITEAVRRTRKIGLGVMGWADALALLSIPYDCQEAVDLGREIMSAIQEKAHETSEKIAEERGAFPAFESPDITGGIRRNATVTCIAPTGSIAIIAGASSGIEPHFMLSYTRYMGSEGYERTPINVEEPIIAKLRAAGSDFTPKTALDIDWGWHLAHQAAFQDCTDLAVSKTINLPQSATWQTIREAYAQAWKLGCKGVTVYRDKSRSVQVLNG